MPDPEIRAQTRAVQELTKTMHNLVRVCEALNENLVILGREMKKETDGAS